MPYELDLERVSRWMAYVLRHNPTRYGLSPDRHGFIHLADFFAVAHRRYPGLTLERLRALIEEEPRRRFEIAEHRVRARYGHSIAVEPVGEPVVPPAKLYHGTDPARSAQVLAEGLKPIDRQLVHLSATAEEAMTIARRRPSTRFASGEPRSGQVPSGVEGRHTSEPILLRIAAQAAHQDGIAFYHEGAVYLAAHIPPQFLSVE